MGENLNAEARARSIAKELVDRIATEDDVALKAASETKIRIAIENALFSNPVDGEFARGVEAAATKLEAMAANELAKEQDFYDRSEDKERMHCVPRRYRRAAEQYTVAAGKVRALSPASVGMGEPVKAQEPIVKANDPDAYFFSELFEFLSTIGQTSWRDRVRAYWENPKRPGRVLPMFATPAKDTVQVPREALERAICDGFWEGNLSFERMTLQQEMSVKYATDAVLALLASQVPGSDLGDRSFAASIEAPMTFDAWIEELNDDVIQGEYGYEPGEMTVYPDNWRSLFDEGLTPSAAFKRALAALSSASASERSSSQSSEKET